MSLSRPRIHPPADLRTTIPEGVIVARRGQSSDGRGIAGVTATTTMGGPGNDDVDPRGDDDDNTTISLAMAAAMRVAGDE